MGYFLLLGVFVAFIIFAYVPQKQELTRIKQRQAERAKIELRESGGGMLYTPPNWDVEKNGKYFNYDIRSWNAGKDWYAVKFDDDWGIKILGDAREMYPGLLEHIRGMQTLTDYVEKNGAIDGTDSLGLEALSGAGFTVKVDTTQ